SPSPSATPSRATTRRPAAGRGGSTGPGGGTGRRPGRRFPHCRAREHDSRAEHAVAGGHGLAQHRPGPPPHGRQDFFIARPFRLASSCATQPNKHLHISMEETVSPAAPSPKSAWRYALALVLLAWSVQLYAIWSRTYPPLVDYPNHMARHYLE